MKGFIVSSLLIAMGMSSFAQAAEQGRMTTCSVKTETRTFLPGDAGFDAAIAQHDASVAHGGDGTFNDALASSWTPDPATTAWIKITTTQDRCESLEIPDAPAARYTCTRMGCNEWIPGTEDYPVGAKITREFCNAATGMQTRITWTKQPDGSWTVTSVRQDIRVVSCPAE